MMIPSSVFNYKLSICDVQIRVEVKVNVYKVCLIYVLLAILKLGMNFVAETDEEHGE